MTLPKVFAPVRQACAHYPDFCPRNAVEGSDRCELHQMRVVAAAPLPAPAVPAVPPGAVASQEAYDLAGLMLGDDDELRDLLGGDLDLPPRMRRRSLARIKPPEPREALLTFDGGSYGPNSRVLVAHPQRPFKPRGLMLWNAEHLNVEAAIIGNSEQIIASCGSVPARWFMTSQNYEQVVAALEAGNEPGRGWGTWDVLRPGILCRLIFDGPVTGAASSSKDVRALMWGHST